MIDKLAAFLNNDFYADARLVRGVFNSVKVRNSEVKEASSGEFSAYSFRVLINGAFGFAASNDFSKVKETFERAVSLARASEKKNLRSKLSPEKTVSKKFEKKPEQELKEVSLEEIVERLVELNKLMKKGKITSYSSLYNSKVFEYYYLNSEGTNLSFSSNYSKLFLQSFAKNESTKQVYSNAFAGFYGFEFFDKYYDKPEETSLKAIELLKAEKIKPGVYDVVLEPQMTGVFSHEVVGHACEADHVLTGESILKDKIGEIIAPETVSIVDDPLLDANGFYPFDDEGVLSQKTFMIRKGILSSFLHSRETAAKMNTHSTGNARAESVFKFPIVRMSNIVFEKGDASDSEILEGRVIVFESTKGGQVDPTSGSFQFDSQLAYYYENGERKKVLRDVIFSGNLLDTLKNIVLAGKNVDYDSSGTCGKSGQGVPVSDGGPRIRVSGVHVS